MSGEHRIVQGWFEVWEAEPGLFAIREPFHSEQVYSYLLLGRDRALLIDSGTGVGDIRAVVEEITRLPVTLLNSHAHWDHIGGNFRFDEIWIHEAEAAALEWTRGNSYLQRWFAPANLSGPLPPGYTVDALTIPASKANRLLTGGETIELGGRTPRVLHAPGHSAGGLVIVDDDNRFMLSTDVVYAGQLYAFNDDSSIEDYRTTLRMLAREATGLTALFPSHNASPIDPAIIGRMATAMDEIAAGRPPESSADGRDTYAFDGFGVITKSAGTAA